MMTFIQAIPFFLKGVITTVQTENLEKGINNYLSKAVFWLI